MFSGRNVHVQWNKWISKLIHINIIIEQFAQQRIERLQELLYNNKGIYMKNMISLMISDIRWCYWTTATVLNVPINLLKCRNLITKKRKGLSVWKFLVMFAEVSALLALNKYLISRK